MLTFGDADIPWMPSLLDLERLKAEGAPEERFYYAQFGWEQLEVPDRFTHVTSRMEVLNQRFLQVFGWRTLGFETMEQWQTKLQEVMDSNVERFDRAYELYDRNRGTMLEDVLRGRKTTVRMSDEDGGQDTETSEVSSDMSRTSEMRHSDTPDSLINSSESFAGSLDMGEGSDISTGSQSKVRGYGKTKSHSGITTETETGAAILESVNATIDGWRDIDSMVIETFARCFLNVFWY